jgi:cytoskeleton protein RodZ
MSEAGAAAETVTAGMLLREAREAAGLHVATLAANLKVPVRKLEALEEDRYDLLPDAVFVRALASSVCRTLKIDPQPVLQRLPQTAQPRLVQDTAPINVPFRAPGDGPNPGLLDHFKSPVAVIVALLLIGAVALVFVPVPGVDGGVTPSATTTEPVMPPSAAEASSTSPQVTTAISPALPANPAALPAAGSGAVPTAASVTPAPDAGRVAGVTPGAQSPAPTASAAAGASAAAAAASAAAAPPTDGVVVFRTRGASWVKVTDAGGVTVLQRLMAAGETAGASGKLPLSVTVGDAQQTDVQVRGKPHDLAPLTRDNVARFEVK